MKKNLLALLCVLSILVGVFALTATATTPTEDTFQVGYAKVDINPYELDDNGKIKTVIRDGVEYQKIMPVPLRGTGSAYKRLAYNTKLDDNGDGNVDANDGLFLTCIAVSDYKGNTVLLFTMDAIGDMGHTALARKEICKKLGAEYGITEDRIMVSGTHAHGGVDLTALDSENLLNVGTANGEEVLDADGNPILGTEANACLSKWKTRLIEKHFVDAAKAALDDRKAATVKKGQVEASTVAGKVMNSVRHYIAPDQHNKGQKYVSGDNFNLRPSQNGSTIYAYESQVSEVDQTLHTISFEFADTSRAPIALVNWRCHPSLNSRGDNNRFVTSDYVNAFRYRMEQAGYRAAFFQGAGGNNNPTSRIPASSNTGVSDWIVGDKLSGLQGNTYGSAVADVALKCLSDYMDSVQVGQIQTLQQKYEAKHVTYNEYEVAAAKAAIDASKLPDSDPNKWPNTTGNKNSIYPWEETPFKYTYTDKETGVEKTICIASISHANKIWEFRNKNEQSTRSMEINTLLLGPEIAIVTTPGEAFDRYSVEAVLDLDKGINTANNYNDWDKLIGVKNAQYGEPLIFGYANLHVSYIPNYLAYEYNASHADTYSTSSYESYMTPLARGEGEKMVAKLADMLNEMVNGKKGRCQHCKQDVPWYPLNSFGFEEGYGHYYLSDHLNIKQQELNKSEEADKIYCLDLNGYTLTGASRAFVTYAGTTLNIMDSSENSSGKVVGTAAGSMSGGTFYVRENSTVNIYGGEFSYTIPTGKSVAKGGVICTQGIVNIFGGQILGGTTTSFGGAICLDLAGSQLNVYGGTVSAGDGSFNSSNCVAVCAGVVTLAGDAEVEELYYAYKTVNKVNVQAVPTAETFHIVATADNAAFTGSVVLNKANVPVGEVIGSCAVQWASKGAVTISDGTDVVLTKDGKLLTQAKIAGVAAVVNGDSVTAYQTLEEAIAKVGDGYIVLGQDVETLTVSQNITVDLNGKTVKSAGATNGATLALKDSKTDDYYIGDQFYGVVESITGNVVAAENYVAATDTKGTSYHRYDIELKSVVLSPSRNGLYYKSDFLGDAMVAQQVEIFGTALSVSEVPYVNDKTDTATYSAFTADKFGGEGNGTILYNIMQSTNSVATNTENSQKQVYGLSYIKWTDGSYKYSKNAAQYSLQDLTVAAYNKYDNWDALDWNDPEKDVEQKALVDMYSRFSVIMKDWDIPGIKTAYAKKLAHEEAAEAAVLKVLVLGNSHSQDTFWLLNELINVERIPENAVDPKGNKISKVTLGVMYQSGCYMYQHASNAENNTAAYTYHKSSYAPDNYTSGWVNREKTTLRDALKDEKWDIVVLQEMNMDKGIAYDYHTSDTQYVVNYVKRTLGYAPQFMWNMVWANPEVPKGVYSTEEEYKQNKWLYQVADPSASFVGEKAIAAIQSWEDRMDKFYGNDGQTHHDKMAGYVQKYIVGRYGITEDKVVTPGTAVMYALNKQNLTRSAGTADEIYLANEQYSYRDYTHLSDESRVMIAYLWYAELFGLEQIDAVKYSTVANAMRAKPELTPGVLDITDVMKANIKEAVNYTLRYRFGQYQYKG